VIPDSALLARLRDSWIHLPDKPEETAEYTMAALTAFASSEAQLHQLVEKRVSGVPLSHLTGRQKFMEIDMLAGPEALIPRKETEILARGALQILGDLVHDRGDAQVIDVCCGSGNVALALATYEPRAHVLGSDLSPEAVSLATRNAAYLGLQERCQFTAGDLFAPFHARADLVTCNPPYISSGKLEKMPPEIANFEPKLAFDGGPFGINILARLIREAPRYLKPNSWLAFEVGLGQGRAMTKMLARSPDYFAVETLGDASGEIRAVLARTAVARV